MCGVFGFVSNNGRRPDLKRLEAIAAATQKRGRHAFGFAWIDSRGRLRSYKQTGRVVDYLGLLNMARDAKMLIGHCRFATQGDPANNLNNHPHPADGGWYVHNGVIGDYRAIIEEFDLYPVTDCDSEVIGLMIEEFDGSLSQRVVAATEQIAGDGSAVVLGLWCAPARLVAVRSGNPLHVAETRDGVYLASLATDMPKNVKRIKDDHAITYTLNAKGPHHAKVTTIDVPAPGPGDERYNYGDDDDFARSGQTALWN